jgi:polyphosphate kinase 2 (PPK2 family)
VLVKFWLQISPAEQLKRFERRAGDPLRAWKLTAEDWENRAKRPEYELAVEEMLDLTDRPEAPWHLVSAESKRHARVEVVRTVIAEIEAGMRRAGQQPPPQP